MNEELVNKRNFGTKDLLGNEAFPHTSTYEKEKHSWKTRSEDGDTD
jgi:hypothetical protein